MAGTNRLNSGSDEGLKIFVKKKLVHPDYGPIYNDYDIALLFVSNMPPLIGDMAAIEDFS